MPKERSLAIDVERCPDALRPGLSEIMRELPARFREDRHALKVSFAPSDDAHRELSVSSDGTHATVNYPSRAHAFRALGRLLGNPDSASFTETCRFTMLGAMLDVSRNGVLRVDTAKTFLRRLALMGFNVCMLYAEDTYEVPGEPFFGYLRGRYSLAELKELDDYAAQLGIEMFPCIQTLGHLEQILKWPVYKEYQDAPGVLIAEEERTYALLEKMIDAASSPFRSKRIHLGMDEAHGVGTGQYKARHGEKRPFDLLNSHLKEVRKICEKRGLRPMIWSDMYFRLGSKRNDYYDLEWSIPPEVVEEIPRDIALVYWDYYHVDPAFYEEWIERHRKLGSEPLMAGGVWTWNRFWSALPWSMTCTDACMRACKTKGLKEVFVTTWGDDGTECDLFSALPGIQYFAEHAYSEQPDPAQLRANFAGSCAANFDDWVSAAALDSIPELKDPRPANLSKWLLWQDPLLSFADPNLRGCSARAHYTALAEVLKKSSRKPGDKRLEFPAQLALVLALKCDLRKTLANAYRADDRAELSRLLKTDVAPLRREFETLRKIHRNVWMELYKPFGWEVLDLRYGGQGARLETLSARIGEYASGKLDAIAELEAEFLPAFNMELPVFNYDQLKTPSSIK